MLSSHIVTFTLAVSHSNASLSSSGCSVHKILHLRSLCTQSTFVQWTADRKSKTLLTCHVADPLDFPTEAFYSCPQGTVEVGRRAPGEQSQEHQSVNHTSSPTGDSPACANDVIIRHQLKAERWHFISAWPQPPSLPFTYIMRGLYVSHNWSHMSVFFAAGSQEQSPSLLLPPPPRKATHSFTYSSRSSPCLLTRWHDLCGTP